MDNTGRARQDAILHAWFGTGTTDADRLQNKARWWQKDARFDQSLREQFEADLTQAIHGECDGWIETPHGSLALIILTDQFSRNIYRDTPAAFAQDARALSVCLDGLERKQDHTLSYVERAFFYMPLMHSESGARQDRSVDCFKNLLEDSPEGLREWAAGTYTYAERHAAIIKRFGRYPHRNAILGRKNTDKEMTFLNEPGSSF